MSAQALAVSRAIRAPQPDGEVVLIETTCRCPICRKTWIFEKLGTSSPEPMDGATIGPGLLCGEDEARRRLRLLVDGEIIPLWTDRDASQMWGAILGARDRGERTFDPVVRILPWDPEHPRALRDDKEEDLARILFDRRGNRRTCITRGQIEGLGLHWKADGLQLQLPDDRFP